MELGVPITEKDFLDSNGDMTYRKKSRNTNSF